MYLHFSRGIVILAVAGLSACCSQESPTPIRTPAPKDQVRCADASKVAVQPSAPGTPDQVAGRAGAVVGESTVTVFSDALLQKQLGEAVAEKSGAFGPIEIGDNQHAVVWVQSGGDGCAPLELENDIEATTTDLTRTPPAIVESGSAVFAFVCAQPPCTFQCQIDDQKPTPCKSPHTISGLEAGSHELRVQAIDAAGNVELIPTEFSFLWASGVPKVTFTTTPAAASGTTANFAFKCDKSECLFECKLDEGRYELCTSPHRLESLSPGEHTLLVRTHGDADAAQAEPARFVWKVEKTQRGEP